MNFLRKWEGVWVSGQGVGDSCVCFCTEGATSSNGDPFVVRPGAVLASSCLSLYARAFACVCGWRRCNIIAATPVVPFPNRGLHSGRRRGGHRLVTGRWGLCCTPPRLLTAPSLCLSPPQLSPLVAARRDYLMRLLVSASPPPLPPSPPRPPSIQWVGGGGGGGFGGV